jgi:hypothetical protein
VFGSFLDGRVYGRRGEYRGSVGEYYLWEEVKYRNGAVQANVRSTYKTRRKIRKMNKSWSGDKVWIDGITFVVVVLMGGIFVISRTAFLNRSKLSKIVSAII